MRAGATAYGWEIPLMRVREVEIHHVDLDAGYTPDDWARSSRPARSTSCRRSSATPATARSATLVATDADGRWEVAADGPALDGLGHRAHGLADRSLPRARAAAQPRWRGTACSALAVRSIVG